LRAQSKLFPSGVIRAESMERAAADLAATFDSELGGFGGAPKFPPSASLLLLLRVHHRTGAPSLLQMVETTLNAMKNGGIYDHLGGGFARYATDERWLVPHFAKMLYDKPLLPELYLEGFLATGDGEWRRVVEETLDWVLSDMTDPSGGFYST